MDQKIFVDLSKSLAIAENQHRLSNVRQTETGLTRPHAIAFIRRILLEVGRRASNMERGMERCPTCDGVGQRRMNLFGYPVDDHGSETCTTCEGTGVVNSLIYIQMWQSRMVERLQRGKGQ